MCDNLPPLDFGTIMLGDMWDGCAWGITDPLTSLPADLTGARVVSHWRTSNAARTVGSPDTPALVLDSEPEAGDPTITLQDGTEPLDDLSFDEFMAAREPGDPYPFMDYPWIVSIEPLIVTDLAPDIDPGEYEWDIVLILPDNEPRTFREGTVSLRRRITRYS